MDYFESIIATLLEDENYWVRKSFKVELSKAEKRQVNKPSIPRPEIDLLAFKFTENVVIAFEAKSYLDSAGVQAENEVQEGRYKLFTSKNYCSVVFARLKQVLIDRGMANHNTTIKLGLAAGKVYQGQSEQIRAFMQERNWEFWSPDDIKKKIKKLAEPERGYENDPIVITAKILMR